MRTSWVANMVVKDESDGTYQHGGYCAIDNNADTSVIFSSDITASGSWFAPEYASCESTTDVKILADGGEYEGQECRDSVCIGWWNGSSTKDDPHTQVCNPN